MNQRTLIFAILKVRSSYVQNKQEPVNGGVPDTVQWWIGEKGTWRIKTFAIDHDIHVNHMDGGTDSTATENIRKFYGDIIESLHELRFSDFNDPAVVNEVFHNAGIEPHLEIAPQGFAFWNPDKGKYRTQSQPK
jgi:hypothetical protein